MFASATQGGHNKNELHRCCQTNIAFCNM